MIYCTVGIPSRFSEWCEMLQAVLVAAASRSPSQFIAESLDQVGLEWLAHDEAVRVVANSLAAVRPLASISNAIVSAEAAFEGEFVLGQVRMKPLMARRLTVA